MSDSLYDDLIAPKLREIAAICEKNGMPFIALCEYEPDYRGRTEFMPKDAGAAMTVAAYAARCDGNIDSLYIAIQRYAKEHGHSSMVLTLLGDGPHSLRTTKE